MLEAFHLTELIERLIPNWMDQLITPRVDLVIYLVGFLLIGLAWIDYRHESGNGGPELPLPSPLSERSANTSSSRPAQMSKDHTVAAEKNSPIIIDSPVSADMSGPITDSQVAVGSNISQSVAVHHHYPENGYSQRWTPTEPTPVQILQEIDAALPFDQDHARKKYVNSLIVVWEVSLFSVNRLYPKVYFLLTRFGPKFEGGVPVNIHLTSVSAELQSATRGSVLLVRGKIGSITGWGLGIDLKLNPEIRLVKRS